MKASCLGGLGVVFLGWIASAAQQPEPWQTIAVFQEEDVAVRVKVLRRATPANFEWLILEFENKTKAPLVVRNAHYRIESERLDLKTGVPRSTGGLASGNIFDLFGDGRGKRGGPELAAQAVQRVVGQPSDYGAALLGRPPATGWRVRARLHLYLELEGGRRLQTAPLGVPFIFEWHPPDEMGYAAIRARLKQLLANPEPRPTHDYILDAYLKIREVARDVTQADLLAALDRRGQGFGGRVALVRFLGERFGSDPAVLDYYRAKLKSGDRVVLRDLAGPKLWDKSFIKPVVQLFEKDHVTYRYALDVLHSHRGDWVQDQALARRLSAVILSEFPFLTKIDADAPLGPGWKTGVADLAKTGDRAVIALLRPRLDDQRKLFAKLPPDALGRVLAHRVCDVALEAILTLLDGTDQAVYNRAAKENLTFGRGNEAAWNDLRDRMIAELKKRLEKRPPS